MLAAKVRISRLEQRLGTGNGLSGPGLFVTVSTGYGRGEEVEAMLDALFLERGVSRDHPGNKVISFVTRYDTKDGSPAPDQRAPVITYVAENR